jgi:hypothetical protein
MGVTGNVCLAGPDGPQCNVVQGVQVRGVSSMYGTGGCTSVFPGTAMRIAVRSRMPHPYKRLSP